MRNLTRPEKGFEEKNGYAVFTNHLSAGDVFPLHWHDYIEFEIVVSGTAKHRFNDEEYLLKRGSSHVLNYHGIHELEILTDSLIYCIHFDKKLLDPRVYDFLVYNNIHYDFNEHETQLIIDRINLLIDEVYTSYTLRDIIIKSVINELMIMMIRKCIPSQLSPAPQPIQQMVRYLNEHFHEKITLKKMAKELSFSTDYLGRLFKAQMKCSFNEYINNMRLKHACTLLATTTMSIKEIASKSGYSSIEYFMYAFKKKMVITPNEYRIQRKNEK